MGYAFFSASRIYIFTYLSPWFGCCFPRCYLWRFASVSPILLFSGPFLSSWMSYFIPGPVSWGLFFVVFMSLGDISIPMTPCCCCAMFALRPGATFSFLRMFGICGWSWCSLSALRFFCLDFPVRSFSASMSRLWFSWSVGSWSFPVLVSQCRSFPFVHVYHAVFYTLLCESYSVPFSGFSCFAKRPIILLYCSGLAVSRPSCPFASAPHIVVWFLGISCSVLSTCPQCLVFSRLLYPWRGAYVANIVSGVCLLMI